MKIKRSPVASAMCLVTTMALGAGFDPLDLKNNFAKTPQEEQMCQALIYQGRDTSDRENWMHMHHYCDCIRFTNRTYAVLSTPYAVKYNLELAIGGCDYVLSHTTPDFYMRSEVHLQKGKALKLFKKDSLAAAEFREAIKGNPNLASAYAELSDMEAGKGNKSDALQIVAEGLHRVPEAKSLQRRYRELGGKLPYPGSAATNAPPPLSRPPAEPPSLPKSGSPTNP